LEGVSFGLLAACAGLSLIALGCAVASLVLRRPPQLDNLVQRLELERTKDKLEFAEMLERATGVEEAIKRNRSRRAGQAGGEAAHAQPASEPQSLEAQLAQVRQRARAMGKL
jgi:hypothetical protein